MKSKSAMDEDIFSVVYGIFFALVFYSVGRSFIKNAETFYSIGWAFLLLLGYVSGSFVGRFFLNITGRHASG